MSPLKGNAIIFDTVGVNTGCSYPCGGYYANHFKARLYAFHITGLPSYYETSLYQGTLTHSNQMGDQWAIIRLQVHSDGYLIKDDTSKANSLRTEGNSDYYQTIYSTERLLKGNNRVQFSFVYKLRDQSGQIKEIWYPIRRANNIS